MEKGIPANEKILEIKKNFADVYSIYQKKLSVKVKLSMRKNGREERSSSCFTVEKYKKESQSGLQLLWF